LAHWVLIIARRHVGNLVMNGHVGGTLQEDLAAVRCVAPDRNGVFEIAPRSKSRRRPRGVSAAARNAGMPEQPQCGHQAD
jgi:hypothetical protein